MTPPFLISSRRQLKLNQHVVAKITAVAFLSLFTGPFALGVPAPGAPTRSSAERVIYLASSLSDEQLIQLLALNAASNRQGTVLVDSPALAPHLKTFLAAFRAEQVVPIGSFSETPQSLKDRLGIPTVPVVEWKQDPPLDLYKNVLPEAPLVVVCLKSPRRLMLQAACLAGSRHAPLYVLEDSTKESPALKLLVKDWKVQEVIALDRAYQSCQKLPDVRVRHLANNEEAVIADQIEYQTKQQKIGTLVIANPSDSERGLSGISAFAPALAVAHRGGLLLTNPQGTDTEAVVNEALKKPALAGVDNLILMADLKAIPMKRRPNPAPGKDKEIEMEPLTPGPNEPFTFATGRIFHKDRGVLAMMLARTRLASQTTSAPKVLIASNPGGGLPLLEIFSRNTAKEFSNAGYETTALFDGEVTREKVKNLLPQQNIFLWEGHHKTLVEKYGLPQWEEPLQPALIFLQSCLALNEAESQVLFQRGAVAVVGSSTRTYSASGGAFTLDFFDSILYENQSLGGALRHAKNFMTSYALLKEKRLQQSAKLAGANVRTAWAFTLWGDPLMKFPKPAAPMTRLAPVRHAREADTISFSLPGPYYPKVVKDNYQVQMLPNSRLGGLLTGDGEDEEKKLVPFVFAEVQFPKLPRDKTPRLRTKVPEKNWVFQWDKRRRAGYVLVTPGLKKHKTLEFHIEWE